MSCLGVLGKNVKSTLKTVFSLMWRLVFSSASDVRKYKNDLPAVYVARGLMSKGNRIVHAVWIGKRLSLMERLTIRLLQIHGHEVHLWVYDNIENVPGGVVLEKGKDILSQESIFEYRGKHMPSLPNGGIGSLSHWSDQFQIELLYKIGGIYTQLDVACLSPLDFRTPYIFVPWGRLIQSCLMKCPKGSRFSGLCARELRNKINRDTIEKLEWACSLALVTKYAKKYVPFYRTQIIPRQFIPPRILRA